MTDLFPAAAPKSYPLGQQIACVEREIKMRRQVYPRWVAARKMKQDKADYEIAVMESVLRTLDGLTP